MASIVAASYKILVTSSKFNLNEVKDFMVNLWTRRSSCKKQTKRKLKMLI